MGSLSGKHKHRLLKAAHEQIAKEIDELAGSVEGVLGETRDDELGNQLRERFEQGKSSGKFPLLSGYLSDFRDEEKEEFFRAGWWQRILMSVREPPKEPWDYSSYKGNEDMYREYLYREYLYREYLYREYLYQGVAHAVITDLRSFAQGWLKELARVGYYGVSGLLGSH